MRPPFLKKGDTIAITAPASKVKITALETGIEILQNWGFRVIQGKTLGTNHFNFAETDSIRKQELQDFLDDPDIHCIIAARGGYGTTRFLDELDWTAFLKKPKWLVGFSDLTSIIMHINGLGYEAIHGPMVKTMQFDDFSNQGLRKLLMGEGISYSFAASLYNRIGTCEGTAIGGNLSLVSNSIGTKSQIDFKNKILFLEDVSEYHYTVDRMMVLLKRAGLLSELAGLVIGDFSEMQESNEPFGQSIEEIVLQHTSTYKFPVLFGFPFGHDQVNYPIVMGKHLTLTGTEEIVTITQ